MYELQMAQESYLESLRALNERSRLHRVEIQPRLAAAVGAEPASLQQIRAALEPFVLQSAINQTDQLIGTLRRAFQRLNAVKGKFREHAVAHFGSDDFTDFDFPETYGLTDGQPELQDV
jgi:hypothetical protein